MGHREETTMTSTAKKAPFEKNTTYEAWTPPDTADITALRNYDDTPETLQPALEAQYNRAKERNATRYRSQYNQGGTTEAARLAQEAEADRGLMSDYGGALGQAAFDSKQQGLARRTFLAGLTVPRPLATKESGYNSQVTDSVWGRLLDGATRVATAGVAASDERLKNNIKPQRPVLDKLDNYQAKEWDWKNGDGHAGGVVAQDMEESFPEAVVEGDESDPKMVNYGDPSLAAQALQGVKELNDKFDQAMNSLQRQRQMGARRTA
jgi:hypothetical protein